GQFITQAATDPQYSESLPRTGKWPLAPYSAPSKPHTPNSPTPPPFYRLRLLALGHPYAVDNCRRRLHKLGYAEVNDWSIPLPIVHSTEVLRTADPGDVMRILTKRIAPPV
ncbi:MAG: hypothetical protein WBA10_01255, partial [Elainellaceae cyanobacterium]